MDQQDLIKIFVFEPQQNLGQGLYMCKNALTKKLLLTFPRWALLSVPDYCFFMYCTVSVRVAKQLALPTSDLGGHGFESCWSQDSSQT